MPRTIRVGMKSGVLPQPRQVVPRMKTSYELAHEAKMRSGFADPAMAPRGSPANAPPRAPKTVAEKVRDSAKAPTRAAAADASAGVSEQRAWKQHMADVRRAYFSGSLAAYEAQERQHREQRERRHASADTQPVDVEDSEATRLTLPTVESSLLAGAMVQPRTAEESEELQLKRTYNRKRVEHELLARQSEQVLDLYQQASQFIVTSEQLEAAVSRAFRPDESVPSLGQNAHQTPAWFKYLRAFQLESEAAAVTQRSREALLSEAAKGTVGVRDTSRAARSERELPGLKEVRDVLNSAD